jgi:hypothetical protein
MTCGMVSESVLDLARGVALPESAQASVRRHLAECPRCAADFERQRNLTADLRAVANSAQTWGASPEIEARLQAALAAREAPAPATVETPATRRPRRWVYAAAAAAALALATWIGTAPTRISEQPQTAASLPAANAIPGPTPASVAPRLAPVETRRAVRGTPARPVRRPRVTIPARVRSFEFLALPGAAGLPDLESGSVVRIDLPVAALPEYGVDIVPDPAKSTVQADLLVGQDGQPRAIRLVGAEESTHDTRSRR